MTVSAIRFLLQASLWGALLYYLSTSLADYPLWFTVLAVLLVSLPIALTGIYSATIRQIRRLEILARRGWLFRLLSGRPLKAIIWFCWAIASGFFMLLQFQFYSLLEWGIFLLVIPVFWTVFHLCRAALAHELRPYLLINMALTWSRWLTPLIMVLVYIAVLAIFNEPEAYASIQDAVDASQANLPATTSGSALIYEASRQLAFHEGLRIYALGRVGDLEAMGALLLTALSGFVIFFNACAMLSCFLIPAGEYRRIFGPLCKALPDRVPPSRIAGTVAVSTFLALFIYVPVFAYLEAWVQQHPEAGGETRRRVITQLERIDNDYFNEGTMAALEQARIDALVNVEASLARFEEQMDQAFNQLEGNVDVYLDWYYSLAGEYARIANLMVGDLETYMTGKLKETLLRGDAFAEAQASFNAALAEHEEAQRIYHQAARDILSANRVQPVDDALIEISRQSTVAEIMSPPVHRDLIDFEQRMLMSGGGAAVASVISAGIVQKVVAKVVSKNTFKLAVKGMAKVVMSKAAGSTAGAGAGAAMGATLGSVVPGIGTAIGAVVGGIAGGIAVGLGIDKILIEIEETVNREAFRADILAAIEESRLEFKASLP